MNSHLFSLSGSNLDDQKDLTESGVVAKKLKEDDEPAGENCEQQNIKQGETSNKGDKEEGESQRYFSSCKSHRLFSIKAKADKNTFRPVTDWKMK